MSIEVSKQREKRVILDFSDEKSFPSEILDVISKWFEKLSESTTQDIINSEVEYNSDVSSTIEEKVPQDIIEELSNSILQIINKSYFLVYHITKVIDSEELRKNGLQTNKIDRYIKHLSNNLRCIGACDEDISIAMEMIKRSYEEKYWGRESHLCFFPNYHSIIRKKDTYDIVMQFSQNIGGELARKALSEKLPSVYKLLADSGKQVVVKALLPSENFFYSMENVAKQFLYFYGAKLFWKREYTIDFDCSTLRDLPPYLIIDVFDFPRFLEE